VSGYDRSKGKRRGALHVGIVVPYDLSEPGGVKHHALELATALRARGDKVTVVGPSGVPVDAPGVVSFPGVMNIVSNGSDNRLGVFVSPWRVWRFFRSRRFDVIHIHEPLQPSLPYWAMWSTLRTPHVATFHAFGEHQSRVLQWTARSFSKLQVPFVQRAIAVSTAAAQYASGVWRKPLQLVPNGVRVDVFRPGMQEEGGPLRLLFVGRISDERKGLRPLLEALRECRNGGLDVELSVVGDSAGGAPPPSAPGMTYHGPLSRRLLVEQYQRCDVFVAPSTGQESFGIVLLEAMACAKAIICSDIPGYRTTVAGAHAMLVEPGSVKDLVAAIRHVSSIRGQLATMGAHNRALAEGFDWKQVAEAVRAEYCHAVGAVRSGAVPAVPPVLAEARDSPSAAAP
jgi:phosphatidylinositol alpha-mannosyltransferase